MAQTSISTTDVAKARRELDKMRRSLSSWLKYRVRNDQVLAGNATRLRVPLSHAQRVILKTRDMGIEQDLADKLHALLGRLMPGQPLPNPDVSSNPSAAVDLAQIALAGGQVQTAAPVAGIFSAANSSHPWLWPVLIVGGLLIAITTAIKTAADVAKDSEEKACIMAGACTDSGFWLKWAAIAGLGWLAYTQFGGKKLLKGGRD